jgi:dipeptidyl aminopeptidase/acylaminoacyl peptidase
VRRFFIGVLLLEAAIIVVFALGSQAGRAATTARSTFRGANGEIVVVRDHHDSRGIGTGTGLFVVEPDGSEGHWFYPGLGQDPTWSADGRNLLFAKTTGGSRDLWVADHGGRPMRISHLPYDFLDGPVDWSHDGANVALVANVRGNNWLYTATMRRGRMGRPRRVDIRPLTVSFGTGPAWSPTAAEIAFIGNRNLRRDELALVNTVSNRVRVLVDSRFIGSPSWSPDGRELAFIRCTDHAGDFLSVVNRDGRGVTTDLLRLPGGCLPGHVAWSPDGREIAFVNGESSGDSLRVVDANGTNQRTILQDIDGLGGLSWQPLRG